MAGVAKLSSSSSCPRNRANTWRTAYVRRSYPTAVTANVAAVNRCNTPSGVSGVKATALYPRLATEAIDTAVGVQAILVG
jgi:hypothetical protein